MTHPSDGDSPWKHGVIPDEPLLVRGVRGKELRLRRRSGPRPIS